MALIKSIARVALGTALLLLIPLVAQQFSAEMAWSPNDFITAGILLFVAGLLFVLIARLGDSTAYRLAVALAVGAGLLLIWGNLAVGFIGNEDNPANLLYGGVLAVALTGAFVARFRPRGMSNAMFAAALTQFLVPVVAALIWRPEVNMGMAWVFMLNAVFAGLWVGAGLLFRRATATTGLNPTRQLAS